MIAEIVSVVCVALLGVSYVVNSKKLIDTRQEVDVLRVDLRGVRGQMEVMSIEIARLRAGLPPNPIPLSGMIYQLPPPADPTPQTPEPEETAEEDPVVQARRRFRRIFSRSREKELAN